MLWVEASAQDNEADAPWEELLPHLSGTLELAAALN